MNISLGLSNRAACWWKLLEEILTVVEVQHWQLCGSVSLSAGVSCHRFLSSLLSQWCSSLIRCWGCQVESRSTERSVKPAGNLYILGWEAAAALELPCCQERKSSCLWVRLVGISGKLFTWLDVCLLLSQMQPLPQDVQSPLAAVEFVKVKYCWFHILKWLRIFFFRLYWEKKSYNQIPSWSDDDHWCKSWFMRQHLWPLVSFCISSKLIKLW